MPHGEEWEKNRLAAIRESAAKRLETSNKTFICPGCNKSVTLHKDRSFCSSACSVIARKKAGGSPEVRAAIRRAAYVPKGRQTGPRPAGVIEKMLAGAARYRAENPEKVRINSLSNLPKDTVGRKNGNWRGGVTAKTRAWAVQNSSKLKKWRNEVLKRDGHRCKECGTIDRLEAHHIVALVTTKAFAFDRANGVTLCRACHTKTDSYAGKGSASKYRQINPAILIYFIPHGWQDYDTEGNWRISKDGAVILILISEQKDEHQQFLYALHELIEVYLCRARGITEKQVDKFDFSFTGSGEPGDSPDSPYLKEHRFAMLIEHLMAHELGIKSYGKVE